MKEITVNFQTLTPLWTGDAWGENNEICPSSIMGSLRFWFEIICYFSAITNNKNYENGKLKDKLDEKEFRKNIIEDEVIKNGINFDEIDKLLAGFGISLPSRVFGCTGWKGWIRIKEITNINKNKPEKYNYPRGRVSFRELKYIKDNKNRGNSEKEITPAWYFQEGFYGNFTLVFNVEENIIDSIFYPLLNFIEKYGFLGGKWNLEYERVKIGNQNDEWRKEEKFYFEKFNKNLTLNLII